MRLVENNWRQRAERAEADRAALVKVVRAGEDVQWPELARGLEAQGLTTLAEVLRGIGRAYAALPSALLAEVKEMK